MCVEGGVCCCVSAEMQYVILRSGEKGEKEKNEMRER